MSFNLSQYLSWQVQIHPSKGTKDTAQKKEPVGKALEAFENKTNQKIIPD